VVNCHSEYGSPEEIIKGFFNSVDTSKVDALRPHARLIGGTCRELFTQNTPVYDRTTKGVVTTRNGKDDFSSEKPLAVLTETQQWLYERCEYLKDCCPIFSPSLTTPVPWTDTGVSGILCEVSPTDNLSLRRVCA